MSVSTPYPWEHDSYFSPVIEDDPLLQLDFYFESCEEKLPNIKDGENEYRAALTRALTDLESMRYGCGLYLSLYYSCLSVCVSLTGGQPKRT